MSFRGSGECLALMIDFPEPGLFPVRCQLVLMACRRRSSAGF